RLCAGLRDRRRGPGARDRGEDILRAFPALRAHARHGGGREVRRGPRGGHRPPALQRGGRSPAAGNPLGAREGSRLSAPQPAFAILRQGMRVAWIAPARASTARGRSKLTRQASATLREGAGAVKGTALTSLVP